MLLELKVSNFAIIDNINIEFEQGFNVISGETGSGKSILLKSLSLLMGRKSSSDIVGRQSDRASIEGLFDIHLRPDITQLLETHGIENPDDTLVVKRIISKTGRNKIYLNGSLESLNTLICIVSPLLELTGQVPLIEVTGQNDNKNLLSKSYHLDLVDLYSGIMNKRTAYEKLYTTWSGIKSKIQNVEQNQQSYEKELNFLEYQIQEIESLNFKPEEERTLETDYRRMKEADKIQNWSQAALSILSEDTGAILPQIDHLKNMGESLSDPQIQTICKSLDSIKLELEDISYELKKEWESNTWNPNEKEKLEQRISQLRKLQKKYRDTTISKAHENIQRDIKKLKNQEQELHRLKEELARLETSLAKEAESLHSIRKKRIQVFIDSINAELSELNMGGVLFGLKIQKHTQLSRTGCTEIEFTIQDSIKDQPKPLQKIASGGELSRILLAIKRTTGDGEVPRTYIFDEVDTGVSGPTAEMVGRKLKSIAKGGQVLCVTHLAQVACFADTHYCVSKVFDSDGSEVGIVKLKQKDRIKEIARLISGTKTKKTSIDHAKKLLDLSSESI